MMAFETPAPFYEGAFLLGGISEIAPPVQKAYGLAIVSESQPAVKHYFIDEAGDGTLFDKNGRVIIGEEGCSKFFMIGLADIDAPTALQTDLDGLRSQILADPFLKKLRQFRSDRRETSVYFHATVDPVEVRWEVYKILLRHEFRFTAVIKTKRTVLDYVKSRNQQDKDYWYHEDELYDFILRRLLKDRLHQHDAYRVTFAIRGNKKRSAEFRAAIEQSRADFLREKQITSASAVEVHPAYSRDEAGLQVVDYCLWALQRVCERPDEAGCDRYLNPLWEAGKISLVIDCDDTAKASYGEYYTKKKPLLPAAFKNRG